jgi:prohibitin 2
MSTTAIDPPPARFGSRLVSFVIGVLLAGGLAVLLLWHAVLVRIPPGHVGVLYSLLSGGTVMDRIYPEGLQAKLPWNRMYLWETRVQAHPFTLLAFSAEGMPITVEATTLFRAVREQTPQLLVDVGPDYVERIVAPVSTAAVRRIIARYDSHELYTIGADQLQTELLEYMRASPEAGLIYYVDVLVRTVRLPDALVTAIEQKLSQQQIAASYEFRLISQRQEAERLRIQGIGLRNFYSIVQSALTDKLLTWRGIEATVEVAKSPNTKIVIVGGNKDQLPLILGSDITRGPTGQEAVTPVPGDASPLPDWSSLPPLFDPAKPGNETSPKRALPPRVAPSTSASPTPSK